MARPWQETISRNEFDTLLGLSDSLRKPRTTVARRWERFHLQRAASR